MDVTQRTFGACPIAPVIDIIFGRWTVPILWLLDQHGRQRFGDLRQGLPNVTPKVLTQRLRQLEADGLITRHYYAEMPPRVEYEATELGRSLGPVFQVLETWSQEHLAELLHARKSSPGPA